MALPFRTSGARRRRAAIKVATFGTAALAALAVISSGGSAMAAPLVPAGSIGYNLNANGTGLLISLFGTKLTGATTSATASYVQGASGAPTESATANGEGVFLTTNGVDGKASANATTGGTTSDGSATDKCAQGGASPAAPITVALGLGCAAAQATVDPSSDGPQAFADADVIHLQADVSGVLQQASSGLSQVCNGLAQIPTIGSQILGPACTQIITSVTPTIDVKVGHSTTQITSTPDQLQAKATGSSVDVSLFPAAATGEPLLEVIIPSAIATTTYTAAAGWTNSFDSTLIRISGTLIDSLNKASGGSFPDPLEIPPSGSGTSQLSMINSTPLGQILTLDLADGSTSGNAVNAEGAKVTLLGGVPGVPGGGVVIDTSGVGTQETAAAGGSGTGPATQPAGSPPTTAAGGGAPPAVETQAGGTSPTAVHTGEWWSGSLPLLAMLAALGGGLLGWPRIKRASMVTRLVSRGSR